jgi:hypothetical protein
MPQLTSCVTAITDPAEPPVLFASPERDARVYRRAGEAHMKVDLRNSGSSSM